MQNHVFQSIANWKIVSSPKGWPTFLGFVTSCEFWQLKEKKIRDYFILLGELVAIASSMVSAKDQIQLNPNAETLSLPEGLCDLRI